MKTTMVRDFEIEAVSLRKRLAHQPRLTARLHVAHLAFKFGARHESGHRVDHQHVDRAGAHQRVGDFQRLLAGIRLGDQQFIDIHAKLAGINRIERVFGVDESADAALFLRFRDGVQRKRGLAGGFRPVDFHHPAARQATNAECDVEPQRARGNGFDIHGLVVLAKLHDRALAELTLDLA